MKIIIVGCGKVGEELAAALSQEENDITIIDKNETRVAEICAQYDIMGLAGNGANYAVQLEAGITEADLMIAVTGSDELNLLCCLISRKAGHCHTIARVRNPEYSSQVAYLKEELGLAMVINQEQTAATEIARILRFPSAIEIDTFAKGRVELLRFRIPDHSMLNGLSLIDMHAKLQLNVLVCTVERGREIQIPNGEFVLQAGDVISIVADAKTEEQFFKRIGVRHGTVKDVMIIGGGDIAVYLGQILDSHGIRVKLIEISQERCNQLVELLPKATIIHGDGSSKHLLEEEGMDSMDALVTLMAIDEENVILSLYARKMGVPKVITKINHISFDEVLDSLDMDTTIAPRNLTAEYILQYVRARKNSLGSNMETLHRIVDRKAEALEFLIGDNFRHKNIPLQELHLKSNVLIACLYRNGKLILPRGRDVLLPGDTVIVVTTIRGTNDIEDIFE